MNCYVNLLQYINIRWRNIIILVKRKYLPMAKVVFVSVVTNGTQVVVSTLSTFPSNTKYWLLATGIAHCSIVFHTLKYNEDNTTIRRKYYEGKIQKKFSYIRTIIVIWPKFLTVGALSIMRRSYAPEQR